MRVFDKRVLRRVFGRKRDDVTGEWGKLHSEELYDLYTSYNIFFPALSFVKICCAKSIHSHIFFVLCVYYFLPVYFKFFLKIRLLALSYTSASVAFYP